MVILFPNPGGRSIEQLAQRYFPGEEIVFLKDTFDRMGYGYPWTHIDQFKPNPNELYNVVTNNMTFEEFAPYLLRLLSTGTRLRIWTLWEDRKRAGLASWQRKEFAKACALLK